MALAVFLSAALILALGLAALAWALRGKKIDDHPLCRNCGFDLTGKPEGSTRCSECGGDVTSPKSIRIGHRVARRGWVWGVAPVVALLLLVVVGMGTLMVSRADPNRYKPAWWLGYEAVSSNLPTRQSALEELTRRQLAGQDLRSSLAGRVDEILDIQADFSKPWDPLWGDLIIRLYDERNEVDPRWTRFLSQAIHVDLEYRNVVEQGEQIPVTAVFVTRTNSAQTVFSRAIDFQFSSRDVGSNSTAKAQQMRFQRGMRGRYTVQLGPVPSSTSELPVDLPVTFELQVVIGPEVRSTTTAVNRPAASLATVTRTFTRSGMLRVVPLADPASGEIPGLGTTANPGVPAYLADNLSVNQSMGWLQFSITLPPPVLLAYDVFWEVPGELLPTGSIFIVDPKSTHGFVARVRVRPELPTESTALLLVPSVAAARSSVNALPHDRQTIRLVPTAVTSNLIGQIGGKITYRVELHNPSTQPTSPR